MSVFLTDVEAGDRAAAQNELSGRITAVDSLLSAGRTDAALARLNALEAEHGNDPLFGWQIRDRRGLALLLAGRPKEALPLLEEAAARRPLEAAVHRNLADALRQLGRRGRALAEYTQAVELAPGDPGLRLEHAQYLAEFGMWREAEQEFRVAGHLGAGEAADQGLAVCLMKQRRPDEAAVPLRRLYLADATISRRLELAAALQSAGRDSELAALLAPVPAASLTVPELLGLVQAEGAPGVDPASSRAFAADLAAGEPPASVGDNAVFWGRIALNLIGSQDWEQALTAADRAVQLDPDNTAYRTNRVVILQGLGRDEEATREWEEIRRRDPDREDS